MVDRFSHPGIVHERETIVPVPWIVRREWRKGIDFPHLKEEIMDRVCEKFYPGGVVKAKNCMFCKECIHDHTFKCMICGIERTYAGANLLDLICHYCSDRYLG